MRWPWPVPKVDPVAVAILVGVALMALAIGNWLADPFGWRAGRLAKAQGQAVAAEGRAAVAAGQSAAAADAAVIQDRATVRERTVEHIREINRETILAQPGARQALDPGLVAAARRGLCQYAAYADDPDCAALRGPGPGELAQPSPAGPAAAR